MATFWNPQVFDRFIESDDASSIISWTGAAAPTPHG
jgi:hypothetical protein